MDSPKDATSTLTDSSKRRLHRRSLMLKGRLSMPGSSLHTVLVSCWAGAVLELSAFKLWHVLKEDPANALCCSDARKSCRRVPP